MNGLLRNPIYTYFLKQKSQKNTIKLLLFYILNNSKSILNSITNLFLNKIHILIIKLLITIKYTILLVKLLL